jgi:hypothetical protein
LYLDKNCILDAYLNINAQNCRKWFTGSPGQKIRNCQINFDYNFLMESCSSTQSFKYFFLSYQCIFNDRNESIVISKNRNWVFACLCFEISTMLSISIGLAFIMNGSKNSFKQFHGKSKLISSFTLQFQNMGFSAENMEQDLEHFLNYLNKNILLKRIELDSNLKNIGRNLTEFPIYEINFYRGTKDVKEINDIFVTFVDTDTPFFIYKLFHKDDICGLWFRPNIEYLKYNGKEINVKFPDQPSNIKWENLNYSSWSRAIHKMITILGAVILILISI